MTNKYMRKRAELNLSKAANDVNANAGFALRHKNATGVMKFWSLASLDLVSCACNLRVR